MALPFPDNKIIDIILKRAYEHRNQDDWVWVIDSLKMHGVSPDNFSIRRKSELLEKENLKNLIRKPVYAGYLIGHFYDKDVRVRITPKGIAFCEKDSYSGEGVPLIIQNV